MADAWDVLAHKQLLARIAQSDPAPQMRTDSHQHEAAMTAPSSEPVSAEKAKAVQIASVCHEANRAFCETIGDYSQPVWGAAPQWQIDSAIHGVEGIRDGRITRPEQSHESWSAEKIADGWVYGAAKDPVAKTHHCLVPFADLPPEQQAKDKLFFAIASSLL